MITTNRSIADRIEKLPIDQLDSAAKKEAEEIYEEIENLSTSSREKGKMAAENLAALLRKVGTGGYKFDSSGKIISISE